MSKRGMSRRRFLQSGSLTLAGAMVAGSLGAIMPKTAAAVANLTTTLDDHTAATLVHMCRHVYPHKAIGDSYYAKIIEGFDDKAKADSKFAAFVQEGVASLDTIYGVKWLELSDGNKLDALKTIQTTPFFQAIRGSIVTGLYDQPLLWRQFGYEGSSWKSGGYIERGFDDIGWLPED